MEVAARATNAALAFGLVCDDPVFGESARGELLALLEEHGEFVEQHLEDSGAVRTNHYAADLVGLVDDIKYPHEVYDIAASKAGLSRPTIVKYRDPPTFLDAFNSSQSNVGGVKGQGGLTINGINVNAADLRELMTPRLLYQWQGQ